MPVMGGVEAIRMIRASRGANALPIIGLTADALPEPRGEFLRAGADGVVDKPIDWEALAGELGRLGAYGKPRADLSGGPEPQQHDSRASTVLQESSFRRLETQPGSQAVLERRIVQAAEALAGTLAARKTGATLH